MWRNRVTDYHRWLSKKKGLPSVTPDGLIDGRMGSWPFHHSILTDGPYMISYAAVSLFAAHVSSPSLVIPAIERWAVLASSKCFHFPPIKCASPQRKKKITTFCFIFPIFFICKNKYLNRLFAKIIFHHLNSSTKGQDSIKDGSLVGWIAESAIHKKFSWWVPLVMGGYHWWSFLMA